MKYLYPREPKEKPIENRIRLAIVLIFINKPSPTLEIIAKPNIPEARKLLANEPELREVVMRPIWKKQNARRFKKIINARKEKGMKDYTLPLINLSFYLVDLFRKSMGGSGYSNTLAYCDLCLSTITLGADCTNCKKWKKSENPQWYRSTVCLCVWSKTQTKCCEISVEAGYGTQLLLENLVKDTFYQHIDLSKIYCYKPMKTFSTYLQLKNEELLCEDCCLLSNTPKLGGITRTTEDWHITSLDDINPECKHCDTKIFLKGYPERCAICTSNSYCKYEKLIVNRECRTRYTQNTQN